MKKSILLLTLFLGVFPLISHTVDLPYLNKTNPLSAEQKALGSTLTGSMLSNADIYSIFCGLSAQLNNVKAFFAFPSEPSKNIYKEIAQSYQKLKQEDQIKATAFLGWALIELTKKLKCFSSTGVDR